MAGRKSDVSADKWTDEEVRANADLPESTPVVGTPDKLSDADVRARAKAVERQRAEAADVDENRANVQRARAMQAEAIANRGQEPTNPVRTTDPSGEGPQVGHPEVIAANEATGGTSTADDDAVPQSATKADLLDLATQRGVDVDESASKADIRAALDLD